ncbi:MAG: hypothetical protein PHP23_09280 [Desulfobacterales bacterium]|nr:hypothetical protein [Desulfobacterales bacterium]MDD4073015.1 hypothetical protein [Desulfobacterales bacterium]MDD4391499.1 hypothetical protein [Desulfobacterales bacterium]
MIGVTAARQGPGKILCLIVYHNGLEQHSPVVFQQAIAMPEKCTRVLIKPI